MKLARKVLTQIDFATLPPDVATLNTSYRPATMEAIGFTVRLRDEDFAALKTLVQTVEHRVALKK